MIYLLVLLSAWLLQDSFLSVLLFEPGDQISNKMFQLSAIQIKSERDQVVAKNFSKEPCGLDKSADSCWRSLEE